MVQFNMEAIPKFDIKSESDIRFDISINQTTWIGHKGPPFEVLCFCNLPLAKI